MVKMENSDNNHNIGNIWLYIFGLVVLILVTVLVMGVMVNRKAIDPEALTNFRYMRELKFSDIWTGESFPGHFVTYRPMMASLLRGEYLIFGFNPPAFFTINLVLLILVAILMYDIIYRVTGELLPALLGTLFLITDWHIVQTIYVIGEAQITLAALFGLSALWLVWFVDDRRKFKPVIVFVLILASTLSKEFGLAFALAIFIFAVFKKGANWKTYAGLSIGVVITFLILRFLVVPDSPLGRDYSSFLNMLKWFLFNSTSGFIYTFINLFRPASDGDLPTLDTLRYSTMESWLMVIFQIIPIVIFFILGIKNKENQRITIPLLFLLIGNSLLFFFNYAFRFHFLGKIGMYAVVGFGIDTLLKKWSPRPRMTTPLILVFMFFSVITFWRGDVFHDYLVTHRHWTENGSLCVPTDEYYQQENFYGYYTSTDQETVRMVMEYYGLPIEYCTCMDPYSICK